MTRLAKLTALYDAAKEERIDDALSVAWRMTSEAHDVGQIEPASVLTVDKIMLRGSTAAALAFHDAVLPGWRVETLHQFTTGHWLAGVYHPQGEDWPKWTPYPTHGATAATPALALFLADMAALIAIEEGKG